MKTNLIENSEKNDKQNCSKHKHVCTCFICERVSQNRYQFPGKKTCAHEIEEECASQSKMAPKP